MNSDDWYMSTRPSISGNSYGWQQTYCNITDLGFEFNIESGDTVIYRFGFISDSISDTLGGLMFDEIVVLDYFEGLNEQGKPQFSSVVYPNPSEGEVAITFTNENSEEVICRISDQFGKTISSPLKTRGDNFKLDLEKYSKGIYYYQLEKNKTVSIGKLIVK
jgi:hypothetical protein